MRWIGLALHAEARAEVQVLLALSRNRRDAEWALGTGSVVAKREGREADMTETKPSTVTDRYFVARKRLERLAAKAGIPKTVSEDLIVVLSVAAAGFTERAARLAAEARAKMLEEAARSMIAAFDGYTNKPIDDGYWRALYDAKLALIAALKEPANG